MPTSAPWRRMSLGGFVGWRAILPTHSCFSVRPLSKPQPRTFSFVPAVRWTCWFGIFQPLKKKIPHFFQSLETSRILWTPEIVKECIMEQKSNGGFLSKPGEWVVTFYRELIRPAIGIRCSLEPGCSEYFRQASLKHGLLGLPMQADRFIREPSVVQAAERPISVQDGVRYDDPISDHDEWMKK